MIERRQLGDATLDLLTDEATLVTLSELSAGPVRAVDIEARVPGVPRWTAVRRLRALADAEFARADEDGASPSKRPSGARVPYRLTALGRDCLLEVVAAAVHCEQTWCTPPERPIHRGLWVLRLVADHHTRAVGQALASAPLRPSDLRVRLPHLGRSTINRRLSSLPTVGVLAREEYGGEVRYALTDGARHLAIVRLRAAQCEWQRSPPAELQSRDLPVIVRVVAPLGRVRREVGGTCHWRFSGGLEPEPEIYLAAAAGRVAALNADPLTLPQAVSRGTPRQWCEALLGGAFSAIVTTGDPNLFGAVLKGLSTVLLE